MLHYLSLAIEMTAIIYISPRQLLFGDAFQVYFYFIEKKKKKFVISTDILNIEISIRIRFWAE